MESHQSLAAGSAAEPRLLSNEADAAHFDSVVAMMVLALAGAVVAGAAFPTVFGLGLLVLGHDSAWLSDGGYFFAFALLGGMVGGMIAFIVSIPVLAFAIVLAWLLRVSARDVWFASLIGGWTGFFAVSLFIDPLPPQPIDQAVIVMAVVCGQSGAGGMVLLARRKSGLFLADGGPMRFSLRRLFGLTTAVAILAAVSQILEQSHQLFAMLDDAAITQVGVIVGAIAIRRLLDRPRPGDGVSRATGGDVACQAPATSVKTS
ncbi:MAG TPA: hypothetical protein VF175_05790 [Lacipirellula sp.]